MTLAHLSEGLRVLLECSILFLTLLPLLITHLFLKFLKRYRKIKEANTVEVVISNVIVRYNVIAYVSETIYHKQETILRTYFHNIMLNSRHETVVILQFTTRKEFYDAYLAQLEYKQALPYLDFYIQKTMEVGNQVYTRQERTIKPLGLIKAALLTKKLG